MIRYTVYKTTNRVNGKFYLGVHKTVNPMDDYLGSGTYVTRAIAKYGSEKFTKEILYEFDTQQEAWDKENELVEAHRADPLCMNLRKGGSGGFDHINRNNLHSTEAGLLVMNSGEPEIIRRKQLARKNSPVWQAAQKVRGFKVGHQVWKNRLHSEESKQKMSGPRENFSGPRNHFTGRKWMTHPELGNKPVKKEEIDAHQKDGWVFGRRT